MDMTVEELAARQVSDYRGLSPGTYFNEKREPLTLDEAYRVQTAVCRLRIEGGDKVTGYKVGCTSPEIERRFSLRGPIHGVLFESEVRRSGARLDGASFANLAIEGEMAVRFGAGGSIVAAFPIIELHNLVFRGEPKTLSELIVNNGMNAGVVLPDKETGVSLLHDENATLRVLLNGECIDEGKLWSMAGGAMAALAWLEASLGRCGTTWAPGQLILTSTPLGIHPVRPGDHVEVQAGGRHVHCYVR
jgi:2-keto-4-pentenoate hydratase